MEEQIARKVVDGTVSVLRLGLSGAVAAALLFTGLWTVAQLPIGPSDLAVELFTRAAPATTDALKEGVLYAAVIGFFGGALAGLAYRGFKYLETR